MSQFFESPEAKAAWGSHYIPGALTNPRLPVRTLETHGPRRSPAPAVLLARAWQPGMNVSSRILAAYLYFRQVRGMKPLEAHNFAIWTYPGATADRHKLNRLRMIAEEIGFDTALRSHDLTRPSATGLRPIPEMRG